MSKRLQTVAESLYGLPQPLVNQPSNPIIAKRAPTQNDAGYPLAQTWLDTVTDNYYVLVDVQAGIATWTLVGSGGAPLTTLTGNDLVPVAPVAQNIDVLGNVAGAITFSSGGAGILDAQVLVDGVTITIVGNALTAAASVATTYTEDTGSATPAGNNLNILGDAAQGVSTTGAADTVTITVQDADTAGNKGVSTYDVNDFTVTAGLVQLRGNSSGTATTVGAVTADVITFPLGATPGVYAYDVLVAGFDTTTPSGASYSIIAGARTTGVAGFLTGNPDVTANEEVTMQPSDVDVVISGNNAIVRVTGVAGLTINWRAVLRSVFVS